MNLESVTNGEYPLVQRTNARVDLAAMKAETTDLLKRYPLNGSHKQICLTYRPEVTDINERIYEGGGRLKPGLTEYAYSEINPELQGTYLHQFLTFAKQNGQLGRTRLLNLAPHACYSLHRDLVPHRYHVAIFTNQNCFMVYNDLSRQQIFHIPDDGHIYKMNVAQIHTAFNAGETDRIHLVMQLASFSPGEKIATPES